MTENRKLQVPFHPHVVWSSLARTDNHGFLAPCWKNRFYIFRDGSHTRPATAGLFTEARTMRWRWEWREIGVRWKWKWNESYLTRTRRGGTQQKRGGTKRNTHTNTPGPERANPEKAREKKKRGPTEERTKTRGGGRTEAPEQTYTGENKTWPTHARAKPTWRREHAWN